jgi:salicylate hydroxylase
LAGSSLAVVGAGIGGLTAALALARQGHAITLIERRTGFSEIGAGLQLSPKADQARPPECVWEADFATDPSSR